MDGNKSVHSGDSLNLGVMCHLVVITTSLSERPGGHPRRRYETISIQHLILPYRTVGSAPHLFRIKRGRFLRFIDSSIPTYTSIHTSSLDWRREALSNY